MADKDEETPELWREPDAIDCSLDQPPKVYQAIWYGPAGVEGDVATELMCDDENERWIVSQYQHVEGYIDDYDPNFPFLKITTTVDRLPSHLGHRDIDYRQAVGIGVDWMAYYGGEEEFVASLPAIGETK